MKQFYLKTLVLCLCIFVGISAFAQPKRHKYLEPFKTTTKKSPLISTEKPIREKSKVQRRASEQLEWISTMTVEGIEMWFSIVSKEDKTCVVGGVDAAGYYWAVDSASCSGPVTIPATVDGYNVIGIAGLAFAELPAITSMNLPESIESIGIEAFYGCTGISNINIPNSVHTIGSAAFYNCSSLISITIPNGVTSIEYSTFSGCTNLTNITIPNSVTTIGKSAFSRCIALATVTIPNSVEGIWDGTFFGCTSLTKIDIPNSVTIIGYRAFYGCTSLASITIPYSVTTIETSAFASCTALENITIPYSVTTIGNGAFEGCIGLKSVYSMIRNPYTINNVFNSGNTILYVPTGSKTKYMNTTGWNVFKCIVEVDGPDDIPDGSIEKPFTALEALVIAQCLSAGEISAKDYYIKGTISRINIPFNTSSGYATFWISDDGSENNEFHVVRTYFLENRKWVDGDRQIKVGDKVIICGKLRNFQGTTSETAPNMSYIYSFYLEDREFFTYKTVEGIDMTFQVIDASKKICQVGGRTGFNLESYNYISAIDEETEGSITIPNYANGYKVTTIYDYAFCNRQKLVSITIPDSVTEIRYRVFSNCSNLEKVSLLSQEVRYFGYHGDNITPDFKGVFENCPKLKTLFINTSEIGSWFANNTTIENIELGNDVTSIGKSAFSGCTGLTSINIPSDVTAIGDKAFNGCDGLKKVIINTPIVGNWFANNTSLENIELGNGVTHIKNSAFYGCRGLTTITFPSNVTTIEALAFLGCDNLKKVIVPDLSSWCNTNFYIGYNLTDISNPLSLAHHLYSDDNTEITNLVIPNSLDSINAGAFYGCSSIESVDIPSNIKKIGDRAFYDCTGLKKVITPDVRSWCAITFERSGWYYDNTVSNPLNYAHHLYNIEGTEITNIVIPEEIDSINDYAFWGGSNFKSVSIPNSIKYFGSDSFYGCNALEKVIVSDLSAWYNIDFYDNPLRYAHHLYSDENTEITNLIIPYGIKHIKDNAFYGASSLTSVVFPNGLEKIGGDAFRDCSAIEAIVFPNGLTYIGSNAFRNCSALNTLVIPNTVIKIGSSAFADCRDLYSVTSLINTPFKLEESAFRNTNEAYETDVIYQKAKLYVPIGTMAIYQSTTGWKKFINMLETDTKFKLTYILDGEVYKVYEIQATEVITPEAVPYKEHYIFSGWSDIPYLMPAHDVTVTGNFTIDPEYVAGIEVSKTADSSPKAYYSPDGRRFDSKQRGLNIIRMSDGTVRKVMVK